MTYSHITINNARLIYKKKIVYCHDSDPQIQKNLQQVAKTGKLYPFNAHPTRNPTSDDVTYACGLTYTPSGKTQVITDHLYQCYGPWDRRETKCNHGYNGIGGTTRLDRV